jgi:hypothetical protein
MEPLMATATVTGEVLGTPNETMRAQLGDGEPKLFTPWMTAHDRDDTTPHSPTPLKDSDGAIRCRTDEFPTVVTSKLI